MCLCVRLLSSVQAQIITATYRTLSLVMLHARIYWWTLIANQKQKLSCCWGGRAMLRIPLSNSEWYLYASYLAPFRSYRAVLVIFCLQETSSRAIAANNRFFSEPPTTWFPEERDKSERIKSEPVLRRSGVIFSYVLIPLYIWCHPTRDYT